MSGGDRAHTGMSERQPYTYVVLRYRHDPLAGEFANVGVVLHAPRGRFLGAKLRTTPGGRLTRMFPTIISPRSGTGSNRSGERWIH
jgi:hypothetical protein